MSDEDRADNGRQNTQGDDIHITELPSRTIECIEGTNRYREHRSHTQDSITAGGSQVPCQEGTNSEQLLGHSDHPSQATNQSTPQSHSIQGESHQTPTRSADQHDSVIASQAEESELHAIYSGSVFESELANNLQEVIVDSSHPLSSEMDLQLKKLSNGISEISMTININKHLERRRNKLNSREQLWREKLDRGINQNENNLKHSNKRQKIYEEDMPWYDEEEDQVIFHHPELIKMQKSLRIGRGLAKPEDTERILLNLLVISQIRDYIHPYSRSKPSSTFAKRP
ncbi:hypothetical protein BDQ17DRAFT_1436149 [Cyathus striatus]|nr:hypothetical protein BDQ17DRAFT_1436149 [Cyathus striatus]